jgi:hypothetical protein
VPDLKVVSERSEQEIKQQGAAAARKDALRELTANLIRIVRGAGKPDFIAEQLRDVAQAYADFNDVYGRPLWSDECSAMLSFSMPELPNNDDLANDLISEHALCREALQVVASTLLEQELQRKQALGDLLSTLNARESRHKLRNMQRRRKTKRNKRAQPVKADSPIKL